MINENNLGGVLNLKNKIPVSRSEEIKNFINSAELKSKEIIEALDNLNIHVPERHNVVIPGTPTTIEESDKLLKESLERSKSTGVYVGVTTCPYVCKFCRYYNRTGAPEKLPEMINDDVANLVKEIDTVNKDINLKDKKETSSLYIGGGTPTLMSGNDMKVLFDSLHNNYKIDSDTEITMECTPDTLNKEKIELVKSLGVNRMSMGVQRLDNEWLKSMNRTHSVDDVFKSLELFNEEKMRFNVDLIYGFDGQTIESFCADLDQILKYTPPEITLYRFEKQKRTDDRDIKVLRSERELIYSMQEAGRQMLLQKGYKESPDGWFTRADVERAQVYEDRWKDQIPLIGFGPEAYSYSDKQQYTNKPYHEYKKNIRSGEELIDENRVYKYDERQQALRRMTFDLKYKFSTTFGEKDRNFFQSLSNNGLGDVVSDNGNENFKLNDRGIMAVEEIMRVLVEESQEIGEKEKGK